MTAYTTLFATFYPGADMGPEFGTGFPRQYMFGAALTVKWIGNWLEMRRLA